MKTLKKKHKFICKPCPWCKITPKFVLPHFRCTTDSTWLWHIQCYTSFCPVQPKGKYIAIRKTTKYDIEAQIKKVDKLVYLWNEGNMVPAYEKTIVEFEIEEK